MKDRHLYIVKGFAINKPQEHIVCYVLSDKLESTVDCACKENRDMMVTSITKGELIIDDTDRNDIVLTTERDFGYNNGFVNRERLLNKLLVIYRINTYMNSIILEECHSLEFDDIKEKILIRENLTISEEHDRISPYYCNDLDRNCIRSTDLEITDVIFLY